MVKHVFVVLTNPVPGREAEYNDWYDNVHLPDVCDIPGISSARRFRLDKPEGLHRYLALYEIETDDIQGVLDEIRARVGNGKMPISDAMVKETVSATTFQQISEWPR